MTETEKKIAEIREALEKATPGPWAVRGFSVRKSDGYMIRQERPRAAAPEAWEQIDERYAADARLIANAPEWLQFLLDELDSLRESLAEWIGDFEALRQDRDRLRQERNKLIEGLRWYAATENWRLSLTHMLNDGGKRARDILRETGVTDV